LTYKNLQRYFSDLLTGKRNSSPEEALSAFSTWGPIHGSNANYTRMALALVDGYFGNTAATPATAPPPTPAAKRPRAESTSSSYDSGSEAGHPKPALSSFRTPRFKAPADRHTQLSGFTRGGSRGAGNHATCGSGRSFSGGRSGK
jgi:hypothetical protein